MDPSKQSVSLNYEKKLTEFRARRRRQELIDHAKESLSKVIPFMDSKKETPPEEDTSRSKESRAAPVEEPLHSPEEVSI